MCIYNFIIYFQYRDELKEFMKLTKEKIDASRPTAVNLMWATKRMLNEINKCSSKEEIIKKAEEISILITNEVFLYNIYIWNRI